MSARLPPLERLTDVLEKLNLFVAQPVDEGFVYRATVANGKQLFVSKVFLEVTDDTLLFAHIRDMANVKVDNSEYPF